MSLRHTVSRLSFAVCLWTAAGCSTPSADEHIVRADAFKQRGLLQEAVIEYRSAIRLAPQRGDARMKLADVYLETRDSGAALREYVRAADLMPENPTVQIQAGSLLLLAGAFEDAQTRAARALAADPSNDRALILLANAKAGLKDLDGALSQYQEAVALHPIDRTYYGMGIIQLARGATPEAEASFRKAVEVGPRSLIARLALANFLWATRRPAEAEREFKSALDIDAGNVLANRALGTFYMLSDRAPEAEPHFKAIAAAAKTPDATISLSDYYVRTRRVPEARRVLDDLAKDDTAWAQATVRLAALDALEGFRAQGTDRLRTVLIKRPNERSAQLLLARLLLADGKRDEAMKEAAAIIQAEPNTRLAAEAHLIAGRIHAMLDRRETAIESFNHVLARHPEPFEAQMALATLHLSQGQTDTASTHVQQALLLQPRHPYARALKVRILLAQRNAAAARNELASLQRDYPNAPPVLNLLAAEQMAAGQPAAARAHYAKVASVAPGDLESVTGLVQLDLAAGKSVDARARVDQALKLGDRTGALLILSAQVYLAANRPVEGEDTLRKAIELDPARLRGYELLAKLYVSQQRLPEAERQFLAIVERNRSSVAAHTMLALLFEIRGRMAEAEKFYQTALAIDSSAAVAANNLAYIYADQNRNLDIALQLAQSAQRGLPNEANAIDTLGWVYYRKGMTAAAIRELEVAVRANPGEPTIRHHLGMAYNQAGELDKARTTLREALKMSTSFPGSDEARQTLAAMGG